MVGGRLTSVIAVVVLGVNLIPDGRLQDTVRLAAVAEDSGYQRCRIYDEGLVTHDVHVVSAAVLLATKYLTVGPGITNPYTRHPAQTAAALASLNELASGRVSAGFGAGGSLTLAPLAIERRRPLLALEELILACRMLWSGAPATIDGTTITLREARLGVGPAHIPIWLAGRGPRVLALGGRAADGVMLDFLHHSAIEGAVETVRQAASESHRTVELSYSTSVVMTEADLEAVRPHMTYRLVDSPDPVKEMIGFDPESESRIRNAMTEGLAVAARHVRDEWILPFVVHGAPAECAAQLRKLERKHGLDEFLLPVFDMDDPADYIARVGDLFEG